MANLKYSCFKLNSSVIVVKVMVMNESTIVIVMEMSQ